MLPSLAYSQRIRTILADWALLAGCSDHFGGDSRLLMLSHNLEQFAGEAPVPSSLCPDGWPLEFCERISRRPQSVGFTLEPVPAQTGNESRLSCLCRLLNRIATEEQVRSVGQRLGRYAREFSHLWLGVDLSRAGVRIYSHFTPASAAELRTRIHSGAPVPVADIDLTSQMRRTLCEIMRRGQLRTLGVNFSGELTGAKLAFAHPLEASGLERIADDCGIPFQNVQEYMRLLSPSRGGWRNRRCGLAISLNDAGRADGLTVYHYAAPYFLNDQELRSFVLQLANRFHWDAEVYRGTSRLLDRAGERVRSLLGFTVSASGETSIRLYCRTGAVA